MAQQYEIEAWVNPDAWEDQDRARRAVELIEQSGTDDVDVWTAITRQVDGASLDDLGREYAVARQVQEDAYGAVRGAALLALEEGMSETEVARRARVDRMTVRKWLGKR